MFRASCSSSLLKGYDEPETLRCSIHQICPTGTDVRQWRGSHEQTWSRYSGAAGYMIRRSSRAAPSWVASLEPLAPLAAIDARHVCRSLAADRRCLHRREGPTCASQQSGNPTVAISSILTCQLDHVGNQAVFISTPNWQPPLRRPMLPQDTTSTTLRDVKLAAHMVNAGTTA